MRYAGCEAPRIDLFFSPTSCLTTRTLSSTCTVRKHSNPTWHEGTRAVLPNSITLLVKEGRTSYKKRQVHFLTHIFLGILAKIKYNIYSVISNMWRHMSILILKLLFLDGLHYFFMMVRITVALYHQIWEIWLVYGRTSWWSAFVSRLVGIWGELPPLSIQWRLTVLQN